jgi:hypothetical protein
MGRACNSQSLYMARRPFASWKVSSGVLLMLTRVLCQIDGKDMFTCRPTVDFGPLALEVIARIRYKIILIGAEL